MPREPDWNEMGFSNLALEVIEHHFSLFLLNGATTRLLKLHILKEGVSNIFGAIIIINTNIQLKSFIQFSQNFIQNGEIKLFSGTSIFKALRKSTNKNPKQISQTDLFETYRYWTWLSLIGFASVSTFMGTQISIAETEKWES